MKRNLVLAILVMTAFVTSEAGTISGKVSGIAGESVVYVDAFGQDFPRADAEARDGPEGLEVSAAYCRGAARHDRGIPQQ